MLVDLTRATDVKLRENRRCAWPHRWSYRRPGPRVYGAGRREAPASGRSRDARGVDRSTFDSTLDRLAEHPQLRAEDLRWLGWQRPGRAVVLVIDASGSVSGTPLNTAIVTAAALAARSGPHDQLGVVAFWSRSVIPASRRRAIATQLGLARLRLLALRGGDTTDLDGGIRAALTQIGKSAPARRDLIVLTDGMANEGDDPLPVAAAAAAVGARLHVLALRPEPEALEACTALAAAGGGVLAVLERAAQAPAALARLLV